MNSSESQAGQKRIEDLTLKQIDMIYSLVRVGEWKDVEIGRRYGISQADVRTVVDHYEELRKTATPNSPQEVRNVGRNARYGSNRERQAAYRARLREKRRAEMQLPAPVAETPAAVDEKLSQPTIDTP
jgi:hypothetical protein